MYVSINSDDIGNKFGDLASQDNEQGISDLSSSLKEAHAMIDQWVQQNGGRVISSSGDENLFQIEDTSGLEQLLSDYSEHTGNTLTVGMGDTISTAIKAMIFGKQSGKNQTNQYSPEMESALNGEESQEGSPESEQQKPNDSATPPEEDPTNQVSLGDENQEFEGNGVTENGQPQAGGPVDQENGVDTKSPIPSQNLEEEAAGQIPPQSKVPEQNTVESQQAVAQEKPAMISDSLGQNKAQPKGNSVVPPQNTLEEADPAQNAQKFPVGGQENQSSSQPEKSIAMPVDELVDEHKELVNTLESPSHEDDKAEAENQSKELGQYEAIQDEEEIPVDGGNEEEMPIEEENEQDEAKQMPENSEDVHEEDSVHDSVNAEDSMDEGSEDDSNVDVESLRDEIAQNLLTFKENKQFFEESKQTNPKLYLATISLLRNMIQMAKQLGLTPGKDMDQMAGQPQENEAPIAPIAPSSEGKAPEEGGGFPPKKEEAKKEDPSNKKEEDKKPDFGKK